MKVIKLFPVVAVFIGSFASAAISITADNTVVGARLANGADFNTTVTGWDLTGGNTVAVLFTAENANSLSATFGGEPLDVVEAFDGDRHFAGVAYLINPTATVADLVIDVTNPGGSRLSHAYSIFSLSGVDSVAGSGIRTSNGGLSYTTISGPGYVLGAAENNSFDGSTLPTVTGNPDQIALNQAVDGNASMLHAHGEVPVSGSYTDNYTGSIEAAATVAFNSVPEPSVLGLLAVGILGFARRRVS